MEHGKRCVLDLSIPEQKYEETTFWQMRNIFPVLLPQLYGHERTLLDFGCGPGRFTPALDRILPGGAIGFDPCEELIHMARRSSSVPYFTGDPGEFLDSRKTAFDVVFITLVLGGLPPEILPELATKLIASLKPDGLLFLVEHVDPYNTGSDFWHFYPFQTYADLFRPLILQRVGAYPTRGNLVAMLSGRKH